MPTIICRTCGREVYATASIDALFPEERRCPRCGSYFETERRSARRRITERRRDTREQPGPPELPGPPEPPGPPDGKERRTGERRVTRRRQGDQGEFQS